MQVEGVYKDNQGNLMSKGDLKKAVDAVMSLDLADVRPEAAAAIGVHVFGDGMYILDGGQPDFLRNLGYKPHLRGIFTLLNRRAGLQCKCLRHPVQQACLAVAGPCVVVPASSCGATGCVIPA